MKRRDLFVLIACAAAFPPLAAAAQLARPVIGILDSGSAAEFGPPAAAFRDGLSEAGFTDGRNITIETLPAK